MRNQWSAGVFVAFLGVAATTAPGAECESDGEVSVLVSPRVPTAGGRVRVLVASDVGAIGELVVTDGAGHVVSNAIRRADLAYVLCAYFGWRLGLPIGYRPCSRGSATRPPSCGAPKTATPAGGKDAGGWFASLATQAMNTVLRERAHRPSRRRDRLLPGRAHARGDVGTVHRLPGRR